MKAILRVERGETGTAALQWCRTSAVVDAVVRDTALQLLHHPLCPIVIVPASARVPS
jgi:hypothetical protein